VATLIVALVLVAVGVDAAFAKGGPLHLFDSQRTTRRPFRSHCRQMNSCATAAAGATATQQLKSVEARPMLDESVSLRANANSPLRLTSHRLSLCLLLSLTLESFVPGEAQGKGGTNMHEIANSRPTTPIYEPRLPLETFGGCGRGRYRDLRTRKCRGPADFGN
jgi:hypothetical protein